MAKYSIQDTTLTAIGDAIRNKSGEHTRVETYMKTIPEVIVSKTPNATGFNTYEGAYPAEITYDVIRFPGASGIHIDFAYQTDSGVEYVSFASGEYDLNSFPVGVTKYGNNALDIYREQLIFQNTDVITVRFKGYSETEALGYYAECRALDADGNLMGEYQVEVEREVPNTFTPAQMATEIEELPIYEFPPEAFVITGDCGDRLANNGWNWYIDLFGDKIITKDITKLTNFAYSSFNLKSIPFDLNIASNCDSYANAFCNCSNLLTAPRIVGQLPLPTSTYSGFADIGNLFNSCYRIREIPYDYFYTFGGIDYWTSDVITQSTRGARNGLFSGCYSLRALPDISMLKNNYAYYGNLYSNLCRDCYTLDEIRNLPVLDGTTYTSNLFSQTIQRCGRLKSFTFETNIDGSPKTAQWKSQTIEAYYEIGFGREADILKHNSGLTKETQIIDDATYQALKNHPDSWTIILEYSRYNHDSAVETINSLPDTSAYLASAGGTNTIKFKPTAGAKTDGGAVNKLTEEEIAVAAAKGWTVTFST